MSRRRKRIFGLFGMGDKKCAALQPIRKEGNGGKYRQREKESPYGGGARLILGAEDSLTV